MRAPSLSRNRPSSIKLCQETRAAWNQEQPAVAPVRINDVSCQMRHWTARQWRRTSVSERPVQTFPDQYGGHFGIEPVRS